MPIPPTIAAPRDQYGAKPKMVIPAKTMAMAFPEPISETARIDTLGAVEMVFQVVTERASCHGRLLTLSRAIRGWAMMTGQRKILTITWKM